MGWTVRESGSDASTPRLLGRLTPGEVEVFYRDIPQLLLASPLFDNNYNTQSSVSPQDAVTTYLHCLLSHLPDLLRPGRELLALYHTVCRISRVLNLLTEVSQLHEELRHRVDLQDIVERAERQCVMVADLAVTIRSLTPYLREIVRLFEDRTARARRVRDRRERPGRRRRQNGSGGNPIESSENWIGFERSTGGPLEDPVVRTMVQLLYSEFLLVLAWHELVAVVDE